MAATPAPWLPRKAGDSNPINRDKQNVPQLLKERKRKGGREGGKDNGKEERKEGREEAKPQ